MLIASSDIKDERLSKFADNVEVHFASRKKVEILAKARNLLLQSNFILSQVSFHFKSDSFSAFSVVTLLLVFFIVIIYLLKKR